MLLLGLIVLLGLAIRLAFVLFFQPNFTLTGDAYYYHYAANLLVDGRGFIVPDSLLRHHQIVASAEHPPGYLIALAVPSLFGLRSVLAHQLWSCLLGTTTVAVIGFVGKTIANRRVGLIAAFLAAIYPNLWLHDGLVLSETLILLTTAIVVLVAYRFWQRPSPAAAAVLGVAIGAAALTRAESILLVPLLAIPLPCLLRRFAWRRRIQLAAISLAATVVILGPWVGYNLTRFEHPVTISTNLGVTMRVANCDQTYSGHGLGYWSFQCVNGTRVGHGDLSSQELAYRRASIDYVESHLSSVPAVVMARVGRTWGLFRPNQQVNLDALLEGRKLWAARLGMAMYYGLLAAAICGVVLLRRRRELLLPLLAPAVTVTIAAALTLGETRLRAAAEISLVVLAALALEAAWRARDGLKRALARYPILRDQRRPQPHGVNAGTDSVVDTTADATSRNGPNGDHPPTTAPPKASASGTRRAVLLVVVGATIAGAIAIVARAPSTAALRPAPPPRFATRITKLPGGQVAAADPRVPARIVDPGVDRPNPFVLVTHGKYYLYSSETTDIASPKIGLWVSTDFAHWTSVRDALPVLPAWATWGSTWAPDVRRVRGRYVMYYTALVRNRTPATRCIGTATASTPTGPFKPTEQLLVCQLDHGGSIDPRTFVDANGTLWLHWKSDDNSDANGLSHSTIYAQPLSRDGLQLVGGPTAILTADRSWEGRIVEAPQMIRANRRYWLFYSGNWYNQPNYAIGAAECRGPAGPCAKPLSFRPFLESNGQGRGPGEASFFADGNGLWMVYGPLAVVYQANTIRPVALAHIVFGLLGPYPGAF